jgi:hypothetical protein
MLNLVNPEYITTVEGAELTDDGLLIKFPDEKQGEFVKKEIKIFIES